MQKPASLSHVRAPHEQQQLFAALSAGKSGAYPPASTVDPQLRFRLDANERGQGRHDGMRNRGRQRPRMLR
jgi:hypothetical protein